MKKIKFLVIGLFLGGPLSLSGQCYDCPDLPLTIKYPRYWEDPDGLIYELNEIDVFIKPGVWICYEDLGDGLKQTLFETEIYCEPPIEHRSEISSIYEDVKIFPNPVRDELKIMHSYDSCHITIQDVRGKLIFTRKVNLETVIVNTSEFEPGMYVLSIHTSSDTFNSSFIVQ